MLYSTNAGAVENPSEGGAAVAPNTGSSSFEPYPSTLLPGNVYHSSRSSVSSTASHLFSPKQSRLLEFSPITPPLYAKPSVHVTTQSRPKTQQSQTQQHQQKREGSSHPVTTSPIAPMQPSYISQLAAYMAEMVVYLWYSPPKQGRSTSPFPKPSSSFSRFCQDVLTTTQLSQSVVVLALLFIWRLQQKHAIEPRTGSEFKLTTTALMLANKILDDHTYTNKTWAEVSGLPLHSLNEGEMEFLQGLNFSLHVSHTSFSAWVDLLEKPAHTKLSRSSSRKKLRLSSSIAPSAPTSPLYHPSSAGNPGLGFDFGSYFPSSTNPQPQQATWQLPSQHSTLLNTFLSPPMSSGSSYSQYHASSSSQPMLLTSSTARKRKASGDGFDARRPSSSYGLIEPYAAATESAGPNSAPFNPSSSTSTFSFTLPPPPSNVRMAEMQQDFSNLTSSFTPPEASSVARNPGNLAYYALAAGQQRGGYLAYQPMVQQPAPTFIQAQSQGMLPMPDGFAHPPSNRMYANLPRHAQQSTQQQQPVYRVSQSLSPADVLRIPSQQSFVPRYGPARSPNLPSIGQLPLTAPITQDRTHMAHSPLSEAGPTSVTRPSGPAISTYPQSSFALPAPHTLRASTAHQQGLSQQQPHQHQQQQHAMAVLPLPQPPYTHNHYSSFSNNGLPGVVQWPIQGIANFQTGYSGATLPLIYRSGSRSSTSSIPVYRGRGLAGSATPLVYRPRPPSLEQSQQ